jgi:hypothetical protein
MFLKTILYSKHWIESEFNLRKMLTQQQRYSKHTDNGWPPSTQDALVYNPSNCAWGSRHYDPRRDIQRLPKTPFSLVLARNILTVHRETLTQYVTFKRGSRGVCTLVLCSLATDMSCIDPSGRIVTKSPKVGPLLIFSISHDSSITNKYPVLVRRYVYDKIGTS